eukprot:GHVR01179130.1.p1 GENE.GHVR01179130.1~~GHVR01179130.1.p1  ORF type:complete len:194 (+),score=30.69 GHVR01179130.1:22-582(+)
MDRNNTEVLIPNLRDLAEASKCVTLKRGVLLRSARPQLHMSGRVMDRSGRVMDRSGRVMDRSGRVMDRSGRVMDTCSEESRGEALLHILKKELCINTIVDLRGLPKNDGSRSKVDSDTEKVLYEHYKRVNFVKKHDSRQPLTFPRTNSQPHINDNDNKNNYTKRKVYVFDILGVNRVPNENLCVGF